MPVPISNVTRRVVLAASGTGPYSFTFEILANTDISVYKDDTLLTLTTDYTVTINSNGTGYVTLTATPTGATQIAIVGDRAIQRTSDFVTGGDLFANTINDELDSLTIFAQQNAEAADRSLKAPQTDPTSINMTLPRSTVRANKVLAFDVNGNPTTGETIGDNRGNWAATTSYNKRDIVKDTSNGNIYYANTSHLPPQRQPLTPAPRHLTHQPLRPMRPAAHHLPAPAQAMRQALPLPLAPQRQMHRRLRQTLRRLRQMQKLLRQQPRLPVMHRLT